MRRRNLLAAGSSAALAALAGCLGGSAEPPSTDSSPPWRREGEVYNPGHRMGMEMIGAARTGDVTVGLSYHLPTRFWTVAGTRRQPVRTEDRPDGIHLMASVWHTETRTVLPVGSGLRVRVEREGDIVTRRALWPMLTQTMGFHYGDNVTFEEWDEHSMTVDVGSPAAALRGPLAGAFEETSPVEFEFDFLLSRRNDIPVSRRPDQRGAHGALEPMQMAMPLSHAPTQGTLPGRVLGTGTSGDARFVVTAVDDADGTYLAVSPRTPFNRFVMPLMSLSAAVDRDGTTVFEGPLSAAVDLDRGYHYGTTVDGLAAGDEVTVSVDSPPQVARHIGYESAFLEMPDVTVTV